MGSKERKQAEEYPANTPVELETKARVAELQRARELFVQLFKDESPFVNLGYDHRQRQFALPVIRLLEQEGDMSKYSETALPFLHFFNADHPLAESIHVESLPSDRGYSLSGTRIDALKFIPGMSSGEVLPRQIYIPNPVTVFDFPKNEVTRVALFTNEEDTKDLAFLVREVSADFTLAKGGFKKETVSTKVGKILGIMGTFKAAWVDEETKLEFVAQLDALDVGESVHLSFRRLTKVEDDKGSMTPFGRKSNTTKEKIMDILNAKNQKLAAGTFAIEGF